MKIVIVSGYFNPLHPGHLDYLEASKKLGDELYVIVNNDEQVKLKGSKPYLKEEDRLRIVKAIRCVTDSVISIDKDLSVCESLKKLFNDLPHDCEVIFAEGGDRNSGEVPEAPVCKELGIKMVDNVGGEKIYSSTEYKVGFF